MNLAEADPAIELETSEQSVPARSPSDRWENFRYSRLSEHSGRCCKIAREWTEAMDFAQLGGGALSSGPRWLRAKYKWGPSKWPMHWCEVVERETIDCGAHAALALTIFRARGLTAFAVQLVQEFDRNATSQWSGKWASEGVSCHWLDDLHIYHEATALLIESGEVKLWDASAGSWIDSRQRDGGYGSVTAIRIFAEGDHAEAQLHWGGRMLEPNVWNQLG
jgi:hypothetical protein